MNFLTFVHGTFFELAICCLTSMDLVKYFSVLKKVDRASIMFSLFFTGILVLYLSYISFFAICRSEQVAMAQRKGIEIERLNLKISKLDESVRVRMHMYKNWDE